MSGVPIDRGLLISGEEDVVGEGDGLRYLEERGQRAGCAAHASEDRVAGGAPLLYFDVEVDCEGGVLDGW